ncbi:hypothetical protein CCP3SC15_4110001 [Gammaproteobacteria bacterium]
MGLRSPDTFPKTMQAESDWLYHVHKVV